VPNSIGLDNLSGFTVLNDAYVKSVQHEEKQITIEVGDTKQQGVFHPQFKLGFFDNQVNYSVRYLAQAQGAVSTNGGKVLYSLGDETVELFESDEGFEIGIRLDAKPAKNTFDFTLNKKEVALYYQKPLSEYTTEELDSLGGIENIYQPDNILGSYAIYSQIRPNNTTGHQFKTGKVGHVYRPYAEDNSGDMVWCDLDYNEQSGIMTVTVPQSFLDSAAYPVFVDPDFGYTTLAGTQLSVNSTVKNNCISESVNHHAASANEQIDDFTVGTGSNGAGVGDYEVGAYDMGTGNTPDGATLLGTGSISVTAGSSKAWRTTSAVNLSLTSGNNYAVAMGLTDKSAGNIYLYYDTTSVDANNKMARSADTDNLDATYSTEGTNSYIYSMYGTVSTTGGVTEIPPTLHGIDYQHATIKASRLGGELEQ